MIAKVLTYYTSLLNENLSLRHSSPEGVATLGVIGSSSSERANKIKELMNSYLSRGKEMVSNPTSKAKRAEFVMPTSVEEFNIRDYV